MRACVRACVHDVKANCAELATGDDAAPSPAAAGDQGNLTHSTINQLITDARARELHCVCVCVCARARARKCL